MVRLNRQTVTIWLPILAFCLFSTSVAAATYVSIQDLQGAWWSDTNNPTADFAIQGEQVWLDYDSQYHPCRIEGDILIFELGENKGPVKNRIIHFSHNRLTLESLVNKTISILTRTKP